MSEKRKQGTAIKRMTFRKQERKVEWKGEDRGRKEIKELHRVDGRTDA